MFELSALLELRRSGCAAGGYSLLFCKSRPVACGSIRPVFFGGSSCLVSAFFCLYFVPLFISFGYFVCFFV